jgi:beta-lactamase superfamily II metal-dependent hydrolase
MKLIAFQSGKGDCLLLSNAANTARILVDGGMPDAYGEHVAPALGALRAAKKKIDLIYISHIDQDHIGGILHLLDDEMAWRVHDFQKTHGNPTHPEPESPRPPQVKAIWHNAFHEQLSDNAGDIEDALAASAPWLLRADAGPWREAGLSQASLVTSVKEAMQVSRRVGAKQLGIPLNQPAGGKLMMLRNGQASIPLGGMKITITGPTAQHLKTLRKEWNDWLAKNKAALTAIKDSARRDETGIGQGSFDGLRLELPLNTMFGNPASVTPPNLASLTMLVEEGKHKILLTGDARADQIVDGLRAAGKLTAATIKVDVLKVQHHGSENNVDSDFCDTVIAKHYIFCGNGEHENPDLRVLELVAKQRLAVPGTFKFWINSSHGMTKKKPAVAHMIKVEKLVKKLADNSQGRLTFKFMDSGSSFRVF